MMQDLFWKGVRQMLCDTLRPKSKPRAEQLSCLIRTGNRLFIIIELLICWNLPRTMFARRLFQSFVHILRKGHHQWKRSRAIYYQQLSANQLSRLSSSHHLNLIWPAASAQPPRVTHPTNLPGSIKFYWLVQPLYLCGVGRMWAELSSVAHSIPLTHSVLRWYRQDVYTGRHSQGCMYWFGCLHYFTGLELFDIPNQRNSWSISRQIHEFMASCRHLQRTFRTHAPVASQTIRACCQNWPKSC